MKNELPKCYGGFIKKRSMCQINCEHKQECNKTYKKKAKEQKKKIKKNHQGLIDKIEHTLVTLKISEGFYIDTNCGADLYEFHKNMKRYSGEKPFYAGLRYSDKIHCRHTGKLSVRYGSRYIQDRYKEKAKRMIIELLMQEDLIVVDKSQRQTIIVKEQ